MGGIYARAEGLPEAVWKAIYFHYLPVGVEADAPPSRTQLGQGAVTWAAVSLADKLDTIVGLFAAGERPTGSRDPYGLRRAAQGVIKLLVDLEPLAGLTVRPALGPMLWKAREGLVEKLKLSAVTQEEKDQLWAFFMERLRHLMQTRGLGNEEIQAITGQASFIDSVSAADLQDRVRELVRGRNTPSFAFVAEAYKRANNIVESAWGSIQTESSWGRHTDRLREPAEIQLRAAMQRMGTDIKTALEKREPARALTAIASIQPELARFFDEVRVMVDDPALQEARLALLAEVRDRISEFGNISGLAPKQA
jgi:glycyl-tRNA synthetase beta chain